MNNNRDNLFLASALGAVGEFNELNEWHPHSFFLTYNYHEFAIN